jgi:enterochelin esterase-like enzyme
MPFFASSIFMLLKTSKQDIAAFLRKGAGLGIGRILHLPPIFPFPMKPLPAPRSSLDFNRTLSRSLGQRLSVLLLALLTSPLLSVFAAPTDDVYRLGPDSEAHPGVPQGKVSEWAKLPSEAYPGTLHDYCVYVPAQYDPVKPAALMIFQDGQAWVRLTGDYRTPYVLDNLIYRREIPVMIAVFINPGRKPDQPEASANDWGDRSSNRPQEYNALDEQYAKVIVDELLPVLNKQFNISKNPEDRAIGGASSGAIAAFTVAWHRPDQLRKIVSVIGSFTNIRGGHVYPDLIRSSEKKPLRIFLQDGLNDNRGIRGQDPNATYNPERDWHAQNLKMVAALTEKGYDVNFTWGIGTHSNKQGGAILPDMLRWLWRDYARPDDPHDPGNRTLFVTADTVPATPAAKPTTPP